MFESLRMARNLGCDCQEEEKGGEWLVMRKDEYEIGLVCLWVVIARQERRFQGLL